MAPGAVARGRGSVPGAPRLARPRTAELRSAKFGVSCWHRAPRGGVRPLPSHLFHNWQIVGPQPRNVRALQARALRPRPRAFALGAGPWRRPQTSENVKNTRARLWGGHAPVPLGWNLGFSVRPRPMRRARQFPPQGHPNSKTHSSCAVSTHHEYNIMFLNMLHVGVINNHDERHDWTDDVGGG